MSGKAAGSGFHIAYCGLDPLALAMYVCVYVRRRETVGKGKEWYARKKSVSHRRKEQNGKERTLPMTGIM